MRTRLPDPRVCVICSASFHPWRETQQTCSRPCYHVWWKAEVKPTALENANAAKRKLVEDGVVQPREGGNSWRSDTPGPRSKAKRREKDQALLQAATQEETADEDDDLEWAERARYWESQAPKPAETRARFNAQKVEQPPLVLVGHGVRLRIQNGALLVHNGFTHYPQKAEELRFFPGDKKLPPRVIALDCDGSITLDVIAWLSQQNVPLVQLNWQGEVVSVTGNFGVAYDPELRQAQLDALTNGVGLQLVTQLIRDKITGCQETLGTFWRTPARDKGLQKLHRALHDLESVPADIDALRMIEARAALAYFLCWREVPLQWKGIGRKPIPEKWHRAGLRQGVLGDGTNRHATHPVNAMLNYAYAALESQIRIAAVARGLDPTIGYLHARQPSRLALVYDLMEPLRPNVDSHVLQLVRDHVFSPSDFVVTSPGVVRLHPHFARTVTSRSVSPDFIQRVVHRVLAGMRQTALLSVPSPSLRKNGRSVSRRGRPSKHGTAEVLGTSS